MKSRAELRWETLPASRQMSLASKITARRRSRWLRAYNNVFAVSAAPHRTKGWGLTFRLQPEVVIRFYVRDKIHRKSAHHAAPKQRSGVREIPKFINASIMSDGKKVRVAIPTDVYLEAGTFHAGAVLPPFYGQPPKNAHRARGSACCLVVVADYPLQTFLLGCHHVFLGSALSPTYQAMPGTIVEYGEALTPLGVAAYSGNYPKGPDGYAMDAAFLNVTNYLSALSPYFSNGRITRAAGLGEYPAPGKTLIVLSPNGDKSGPFDNAESNFPLQSESVTGQIITFTFQELISYYAPCQEGDSGSAVVDAQGVLYGMHIYGPNAQNAQNGLSYAIPIARILSASTVGTDSNWTLA
jgi:hypothetical protein